jgi:hypothetical protein
MLLLLTTPWSPAGYTQIRRALALPRFRFPRCTHSAWAVTDTCKRLLTSINSPAFVLLLRYRTTRS